MTTVHMDPQPVPRRPARAHARRNHDRLLSQARAKFVEQGINASLEDIARGAGVGIGTLYRNFPTRQALLEALLHDSFEALRAQAHELLTSSSPGEALTTWLQVLAVHAATYRGLAEALMSTIHDERSALHASCQTIHTAGAELLARAQKSGDVRPDLNASELFTLANAIAWAAEQTPHLADQSNRFLNLVMDGLRRDESTS
jgi:AcrR family transcriptional regulator